MIDMNVKLEATLLKGRTYAVRPANQLGTHGFFPVAWEVQYITASSTEAAIAKALPIR